MFGFLDVIYEDGVSSSFKCLELTYDDNVKLFNNGNPLIDWYEYCKFIYDKDNNIYGVSESSSVGHWLSDEDGNYIEKYIKYNGVEYIFITDEEIYNMSISELGKHMSCIISKDMKSFQDLKDYYKINKK